MSKTQCKSCGSISAIPNRLTCEFCGAAFQDEMEQEQELLALKRQ
jgi:uncharacterized OB-fold protein